MARSLVYNEHKRKPRVGNVITQNFKIMKKLFVLAVFIFLGGITAQELHATTTLNGSDLGRRYLNAQPITFKHQGVRFFVHTNGVLDFKLPRYRGRNTGRIHNQGWNGSGYNRNFVKYDDQGKAIRIGNMHIIYNRFGKVGKIGSIRMRYYNGRLKALGGIQVRYNRYGELYALTGYLTPYSNVCGTCNTIGCSIGNYNLNNYQVAAHDVHWNPHWGDSDYTFRDGVRRRRTRNW